MLADKDRLMLIGGACFAFAVLFFLAGEYLAAAVFLLLAAVYERLGR